MSFSPLRISNLLGRLPPNLEQSQASGSLCLQLQGGKCRSCWPLPLSLPKSGGSLLRSGAGSIFLSPCVVCSFGSWITGWGEQGDAGVPCAWTPGSGDEYLCPDVRCGWWPRAPLAPPDCFREPGKQKKFCCQGADGLNLWVCHHWREKGKKEEVYRWNKTQIHLSRGISPSSWPKPGWERGAGCREQLGKGSEHRVFAGGAGMLLLEQPAPRGRQLLAIYSVCREVPGRGFKSR